MGSLQMRYLRAGCLSSAPPLLLVGLGLWALAGRIAPREPHAERSPTPPAAAEELALERADTGSESGAGRALPGR
jgi:hypothetical protein